MLEHEEGREEDTGDDEAAAGQTRDAEQQEAGEEAVVLEVDVVHNE